MYSSKKSFYVTLPSNVRPPTGHHLKNKTSEFTTFLPKALELNTEDWECALVEISYPHSYNNMHPPFDIVKFTYENPETNEQTRHIVDIPNGYYDSIQEVIQVINKLKPKDFKGNFGFDNSKRGKTKLVLYPNESLKLHTTLAHLLGFREHIFKYDASDASEISKGSLEPKMRIKADFIADIRALHYNLYIYSNIVQPHLCGTQYLSLLRTLNVEGTDGSYISKVYEIPHYLPLASNFIESIEIKITDDLGQNIQFQYGKIIIKLHFKQRSLFQQ